VAALAATGFIAATVPFLATPATALMAAVVRVQSSPAAVQVDF
jgi:hypothetical protein